MTRLIHYVVLSSTHDRWSWTLHGSVDFFLLLRLVLIDKILLPSIPIQPRSNRFVPIKINVIICYLILDRLPFQLNLSVHGLEIPSIMCPIRESATDCSSSRFSFRCSLARELLDWFYCWWDISRPLGDSFQHWSDWFLAFKDNSIEKDYI